MIRNILCPIDRSPNSLQAFSYAIALARWQGARLTLLEVIEAPVAAGGGREPENDSALDDARAALDRALRRVLTAKRAADQRVKVVMRKGSVVKEILAQAKASRADLVVIGSHGRGGVQRLVLGSVAEKVLRLATCPVLTVRRGVSTARQSQSPFRTILCATDFSVAANKGVGYAKRLAKEAGATLVLMHALEWPFGDGAGSGAVEALRKRMVSSARERLARLLPRSSSDRPGPSAVVTLGNASADIFKLARARSVDLIVMGVSGRGALDAAVLGSTTHHVIRGGTWPVLTVRTVTR